MRSAQPVRDNREESSFFLKRRCEHSTIVLKKIAARWSYQHRNHYLKIMNYTAMSLSSSLSSSSSYSSRSTFPHIDLFGDNSTRESSLIGSLAILNRIVLDPSVNPKSNKVRKRISEGCELVSRDISLQIQAGLVLTLGSSCLFCPNGIEQTSTLIGNLFIQANITSDRLRQSRADADATTSSNVLEKFLYYMLDLPGRQSMPQAGVALASLAMHSKNAIFRSKLKDLPVPGQEWTQDDARPHKDSSSGADRVTSAVETFSSINTMAALWPLVNRSFDDVDWLIVAITRASENGSLAGMAPRERTLPAKIAACARLAEAGGELCERSTWMIAASVAVLVTKRQGIFPDEAYTRIRKKDACRLHKGGTCSDGGSKGSRQACMPICIRNVSLGDRILYEMASTRVLGNVTSLFGWIIVSKESKDPFCCGNLHLSRQIEDHIRKVDYFEVEKLLMSIYRKVEEEEEEEDEKMTPEKLQTDLAEEVGVAHGPAHGKRFRGKNIVLADSRDLESDGTLFGGTFVYINLLQTITYNRMTLSPKMFFCELLKDVVPTSGSHKGGVIRKGSTVLVRGPFYRNIDSGYVQTRSLFAGARQMAYLNDFKLRSKLDGVDAMTFCFMVRSSMPKNSSETTKTDMFIDNLMGIEDEWKDRRPNLAYPDLLVESLRVSAVHTTGFMDSTTCRRDPDGSLPLWLVMNDITGDYRRWSWKLRFDVPRTSRTVSVEKMRRQICRAENHLPVHAVYELDMDKSMDRIADICHPNVWMVGRRSARGCSEADILSEKLMNAMLFRSIFGVCRLVSSKDIFSTCYNGMITSSSSSTPESRVIMPFDFVFTQPRYPEFDPAKRMTLLRTVSFRENVLFRNRGICRSREERKRLVLRDLEETTLPVARYICKYYRTPMSGATARVTSSLDVDGLFAKLNASVISGCKDFGGNRKYCSMFNGPGAPTMWWPIIGNLFFMASKVLGLDPLIFGVDPDGGHLCQQRDNTSGVRTGRRLGIDIRFFLYARSLTEGIEMWNSADATEETGDSQIDIFRNYYSIKSRESFDGYDPMIDVGWLAKVGNMQKIIARLTSWKRALRNERRTMRKALCDTETKTRKRARVHQVDTDLYPIPEWVEGIWLPEIEKACDASIRAFKNALEKDDWWDVLEFVHGKNAIERYIIQVNKHLIRCYKRIARIREKHLESDPKMGSGFVI